MQQSNASVASVFSYIANDDKVKPTTMADRKTFMLPIKKSGMVGRRSCPVFKITFSMISLHLYLFFVISTAVNKALSIDATVCINAT